MANIESSADRSDETGEAPDSALLSIVARERPRHPAAPCPPSPSWESRPQAGFHVGRAAKVDRPPSPRGCSPPPASVPQLPLREKTRCSPGTTSSVSGEGTSVPSVSPWQGPCCAGSGTTIMATERRGTEGLGVCSRPL